MTLVDTAHSPASPRGRSRGGPGWVARGILAAVAVGLVASAMVLPLWRAQLVAPQYPDNLHLIAYGTDVTGDVEEIDLLNHYVGMRAFDPADVPEMALWPLAVGLAAAAAAVAVLVTARLPRRLALACLWLMPAGVLGVIQFRLHQYGHDIDPMAALRIPEFTPLVVGPTRVMNFTTWSYPGLGLLALVAAAAVVTFGPRLVARLRPVAGTAAFATVAVTGVLALVIVAPAAHAADGQHDHGQHDHGAHGAHGHGQPAGPAQAPGTRSVPESGPVRDLAALLATVQPGDRVSLAPGRWQGPATIDVPIELHGLGRAVIEGDGRGHVLVIRASGTLVSGVHVRGSGPGPHGEPAGIRVEADGVHVTSTVVDDTYIGIAVVGARGVHLVGNTVYGRAGSAITGEDHAVTHDDHDHAGGAHAATSPRGDGISLWDVDGVLVRDNHVHGARDGIYVSFGSGALLDRNHVAASRYAVHSMFAADLTLAENHFERNLSGVVLMYGGPALLLRNEVTEHRSGATGFGVLLKDIDGVEAVENVLARNRVGLHIDTGVSAADPARIHRNTVSGNDVAVALNPSASARLSANSFVANTVQVAPKGGGTVRAEWTEGGWGNYWDTYRGHESAVAGLGALPHAEGGRVDTLLEKAPVLVAIAGSPGVRLLRELEARWTRTTPAIVDELPLTRPVSPALPAPPPAPSAAPLLGVASALLLLGSATAFARVRSTATPRKEFA